jgi:hypothetical protein
MDPDTQQLPDAITDQIRGMAPLLAARLGDDLGGEVARWLLSIHGRLMAVECENLHLKEHVEILQDRIVSIEGRCAL